VTARRAARGGRGKLRGPAAATTPRTNRGPNIIDRLRAALAGDTPLSDPSLLAVMLAAAFAVALLVTMVIQDTDLWTLLAQGRAIAADPAAMKVNTWTWPAAGASQVSASWLFRVVLWPIWSFGGVTGVFLWRWASALAVFALLFGAARRMGARGPLTLLVLTACAMVYRTRADARPESLAAILLALSLWILETRRSGGPDRSLWLVPVALVWSNAHVSVYLLFALIAFHFAGDLAARRAAVGVPMDAPRRPLWLIGGLALAASLVHPSGWHALWQPFEFALRWRGDPMFSSIEELRPLTWAPDWRSGMPVLIALWPAAVLVRALRRRFDPVEALLCAAFTAAVWTSLRFAGPWAVVAAPFLARDLSEFARGNHTAPAGARPVAAALVIVAIAALTFAETTRRDRPFGTGIAMRNVPEHAATFMEATGVRGRGFNHMQHGGYLAYRFWPDRERLPFITTQPELSTAAVRAAYLGALQRPAEWYALERERRFDYVLLEREQNPGDHLLDVLDQDSSWVMVFGDDAAELYVRRDGPMAGVAARHGYRVIPGGRDGRGRMMNACQADTALRARARAEAERMAGASPENGAAHHLLGFFALMDGRRADAAGHLERTVARQPFTPRIREILGDLALEDGDRARALRWFRAERDRFGADPRIDQRIRAAGATR
jgi:hypothetical protein